MQLTIANTGVRQDDEGRFCLNDLHRASGGAGHHQPVKFFANKDTQALIVELGKSPNSESLPMGSKPGRNGGPYVCKELVYAYAM